MWNDLSGLRITQTNHPPGQGGGGRGRGGTGERRQGASGQIVLGCWMNGVYKRDCHGLLGKPLQPAEPGGECALPGTWAQAGCTAWLAHSEKAGHEVSEPMGRWIQPPAEAADSGQAALTAKFQGWFS